MKPSADSDPFYLSHIQECLTRIADYTQDGRDRFLTDTLVQDAVLRNLQTMAESTQRLSAQVKAARPDVAWQEISAFRNVLVHGYTGISLPQIWDVLQRDLPPFAQAIAAMQDTQI